MDIRHTVNATGNGIEPTSFALKLTDFRQFQRKTDFLLKKSRVAARVGAMNRCPIDFGLDSLDQRRIYSDVVHPFGGLA